MTVLTFNAALEAEAIKRIDLMIAAEKDLMGAGKLPDYETYRYHSGIVQGCEAAKDIIKETLVAIQRG